MTDNLKADLLGLSSIEPPPQLKGRGPHASLEVYREFLSRSAGSPNDLWRAISEGLPWKDRPTSVGGPGEWFPGGTLRLTDAVLVGADDRPAVLEVGRHGVEVTTLGVLRTRVASATAALKGLALSPQERVLVALPPCLDWLSAILACAELGLRCVPLSPDKGPAHVAARAQATHCRAAIIPDGFTATNLPSVLFAASLRSGPPEAGVGPLPAMHPMFILTDSAGQLFTIPVAGFAVQAVAAFEALFAPASHGAVWLATPGNYASSLALACATLRSGRAIGLLDPAGLSTPEELWQAMATCKPEVLMLSARLGQTLASAAQNQPARSVPLPTLVAVEGEQLEPRHYAVLRRLVLDGRSHVVQVLGRPEAGGFVAGPQPAVTPIRPSSVAFAVPGLEISIVDHSGQASPMGIGGLLALAQATPALALELQDSTPPIALEVKARLDHKGYLWTMGEAKVQREIVDSTAGTAQLEAIIASLDDVEQVAVVRFQDHTGAGRSHAFVKPIRPGQFDIEAAKDRVAGALGQAAVPSSFQIVERLPYSRSGKLLRSVLRRVATGEPIGLDDASLVTDPHVVAELIRR